MARFEDPDGPSRVRQMARDGPSSVMEASWRDPDDVKPTARRTAREITGYRTYCPLRKMFKHNGSAVTVQHIIAADELRSVYDLARFGYMTRSSVIYLAHTPPLPRTGPTRAAMAQVRALREVRRLLKRFTEHQCFMLHFIVLTNHSMRSWCAMIGRTDRVREMGKLVAILDVLADYFGSEVDARMSRGEALAM